MGNGMDSKRRLLNVNTVVSLNIPKKAGGGRSQGLAVRTKKVFPSRQLLGKYQGKNNHF
jgi:hypothetical protein